MEEKTITMKLSECERILKNNWDILSNDTKNQLKMVGVVK
jgi:hypothetical protein